MSRDSQQNPKNDLEDWQPVNKTRVREVVVEDGEWTKVDLSNPDSKPSPKSCDNLLQKKESKTK